MACLFPTSASACRSSPRLRRAVGLTLDCHLMIVQPERYVADFVKAGANHITVHVEATKHLHRTIQQIKQLGATAGVALNPATPLGRAGGDPAVRRSGADHERQSRLWRPGVYPDHHRQDRAAARSMLDAARPGPCPSPGRRRGEATTNVAEIVRAGATNLVAGSAIFNDQQTVAEAIGTYARGA